MFNYEARRNAIHKTMAQLNKMLETLDEEQKAEQAIALGYVNGQSLAEEDKLIAKLQALVGETYNESKNVVGLVEQLQKLAYLSKDAANKTTPEAIVQTAVANANKPRITKPV